MLYGADDNINGISRLDMQELYGALSGQPPPKYPFISEANFCRNGGNDPKNK